jgi:hypothetical protein
VDVLVLQSWANVLQIRPKMFRFHSDPPGPPTCASPPLPNAFGRRPFWRGVSNTGLSGGDQSVSVLFAALKSDREAVAIQ